MNTLFKWAVLFILCIVGIGTIVSLSSIYENNEAGEILVIQAPFSGKLAVYTDPGRKWQGWGTPTHYKRSNNFDFDSDQTLLSIRFNDGGHAKIRGTARYDLPLDEQHILDVHRTFGSPEALHNSLIKSVVEKSIYMAGPLMSSKESYAERKSDLINIIEDQAANGVLQTMPVSKEIEDLISGGKKWVTAVDIRRDKEGKALRQEISPLIRFGITLYNVTPREIEYEKVIVDQIAQQQQATMAVQISIANLKRAEQDALTTVKQGEADAAKAKWTQEAVKATEVTVAQKDKEVAETNASQRLAVAKLDKEAAEQTKQKEILLGEGEAKRRQLVMQADGALAVKIDAFKAVNANYAAALANYKGALTPAIVMGGNGQNGTSSVADLMDLLKAKTARDLALDLNLPKNQ